MSFSAHLQPGPSTFGEEIHAFGRRHCMDDDQIERAVDHATNLVCNGHSVQSATERAIRVLQAQHECLMSLEQADRLYGVA